MQRAHIIGVGAVTSVGARAPVAMAAAGAGLSRIVIDPEDAGPDDEDASNVARIATLPTEDPAARGRALLALAVEQALAPIARGKPRPIHVWFAGPAMPDGPVSVAKMVTNRLKVVPAAIDHVGSHGASSLFAVEKALAAIDKGSVEYALVAAFDVRSDAASVAAGVAAERIIGPDRCWGYVPGEAGAAILLASETALRSSGLRSHASLLAVASAREPNPLGSAIPCVGRGLTDAVSRALAALPPDTRASGVFCDLNGERHRSDEWGFTVSRTSTRLRDPGDFTAPATAWGDCGAANGMLLLGLAAADWTRARDADAHLLVWTSSDGPERAAALLQLPKVAAETSQSANEGPHPAWASELDQDVLTEMVDECCFRYGQRAYQIVQAAGDEPPSDWGLIERTEDVLDALTVGLAKCGNSAHERAGAMAESGKFAPVYAAARVLLEDGRNREAMAFAAKQIETEPATEAPILDAYVHAVRPRDPKEDRVELLFAADPALSWLALQVAAAVGFAPSAAWWARFAPSVPAERAAIFLQAIGRMADPTLRAHLTLWHGSADPVLRREAALAEILLGRDDARRLVLGRADSDGALLLPAALLVDARGAAWLLSRAKTVADAEAVLAVGMAGDCNAVPWLLEQLAAPTVARVAAAALEIILGASCFEEREVPDEDDTAPPRQIRSVSCSRAAWEPIAAQVLASQPRTARLRGGAPASRAAAIALLDRPHLPPLVRRYLGHELALRWGAARSFDPTAPIRAQRAWLANAQRSVDSQPAGSWNVTYLIA